MKVLYLDHGENPGWKALSIPISTTDLLEIRRRSSVFLIVPEDSWAPCLLQVLKVSCCHTILDSTNQLSLLSERKN